MSRRCGSCHNINADVIGPIELYVFDFEGYRAPFRGTWFYGSGEWSLGFQIIIGRRGLNRTGYNNLASWLIEHHGVALLQAVNDARRANHLSLMPSVSIGILQKVPWVFFDYSDDMEIGDY